MVELELSELGAEFSPLQVKILLQVLQVLLFADLESSGGLEICLCTQARSQFLISDTGGSTGSPRYFDTMTSHKPCSNDNPSQLPRRRDRGINKLSFCRSCSTGNFLSLHRFYNRYTQCPLEGHTGCSPSDRCTLVVHTASICTHKGFSCSHCSTLSTGLVVFCSFCSKNIFPRTGDRAGNICRILVMLIGHTLNNTYRLHQVLVILSPCTLHRWDTYNSSTGFCRWDILFP